MDFEVRTAAFRMVITKVNGGLNLKASKGSISGWYEADLKFVDGLAFSFTDEWSNRAFPSSNDHCEKHFNKFRLFPNIT